MCAVYKPSNFDPSLSEIDVSLENTFSAQVNTSGEPIKAYKLTIMNGDASSTIYDGPIQKLATPVKNKAILKISDVSEDMFDLIPVGVPYYSDTTLETLVGYTTEAVEYEYTSPNTYATISISSTTYYVEVPAYIDNGLTNGQDYQWGVRTYNVVGGSTAQPNTLVCNGYIVGSTKYVTWLRIPNHGDESKGFVPSGTTYYSDTTLETEVTTTSAKTDVTLNAAKTYASFVLSGTTYYVSPSDVTTYKSIADNIVYDRYIEYSVDSEDSILIGAHEPDTKEKPTDYPYIQRKKIDWVDKSLGTDEDFIKIETDEAFDYDYIDGTPFTIYQCSSEHTVTSAFADPNSNINVANYVLIYESAAKALEAFEDGEKPGGSITLALYGGTKKITGYSSDTGEIRVHDAWTAAPVNGNAYRVFEQDVSTKLYEEVFASNIAFSTDYTDTTKNTYYGTTIYATSESTVPYYSDITLSTKVGDLIASTSCSYAGKNSNNVHYSTISRGSTPYYVAAPTGGTLTQNYDAINVNGVRGNIIINESTYDIPYSSLIPAVKGVSNVNPFTAQVIGGTPISDVTYFKNYSNYWGNTSTDKRLFIQPNINIKTDATNPNEIVFDSTGGRLDIIKQTKINATSGKTIDITFNKLDNSQWLLEGNAIGNLVGSLPLVNTYYINPQTDYKVYTDFMDSAPLNLFYARLTPDLTIQCRSYYQTLRSAQGSDFPFTDPYYAPEGTQYYKDSTCTALADGSYVYLPSGTAYYTNYSVESGFYGDVAYLTSAITENSGQAVYRTNIYTELTLSGTVYYVESPTYQTIEDTKCTWTVGAETGTIVDPYDSTVTRYVDVKTIKENPSVYMDIPSELYEQLYDITEYDYRDIEFNTNVEFTNNQQVKYYNYQLYVENSSGNFELIEESEDIYSVDVEWHFRGFERGDSEDAPKKYKIVVNIVDNYDKQFSAEQTFGIYYPIEEAVVPLDIDYDCHEKGITISVRDPLYVKTTDLGVGGYTTVTSANFDEDNGAMNVPDDKVLNYTNVDNEESTPIFLPAQSELLTQFQIRGDFIEDIPDAGETVVMQLANELTSDEYSAGLQAGITLFNNTYNNNAKYTEITSQPVYSPTTPTAEIPTDIVMLPGYYQCVIGDENTSIFIKGTEGIKYYTDTTCTSEAGTISTDAYAVYTTKEYSSITIGEDIRYVKNNHITDGGTIITDGIANTIIRYNRIYSTIVSSETVVSVFDDSAAKLYLQGLIDGIETSDDWLKDVQSADMTANNGKNIIYAIIPLTSSTRFDETTETTQMSRIKEFFNTMYYVTTQNTTHKTTSDTAYLQTYTLKMTNVNAYYYDEDNHRYILNENEVGALKMYKNGDMFNPLTCFNVDGVLMDHYSIKDNVSGIVADKKLRYALQRASGFIFCTEESSYQGKLPYTGVAGKYYVVYEEYTRGGVTYSAGIYTYTNNAWVLDVTNEYIIVAGKSDLPSDIQEDPASISNAVGIYNTSSESFIWLDTDTEGQATAWIENTNTDLETTKEAFDNLWLTLFAVWDYSADEGEQLVCTIQASKGGKL